MTRISGVKLGWNVGAGSATGESREGSDVDFLVDLDEGRNLFDLGGLLADLKDELRRDVDVVEARCVHPYIRERVMAEAVAL